MCKSFTPFSLRLSNKVGDFQSLLPEQKVDHVKCSAQKESNCTSKFSKAQKILSASKKNKKVQNKFYVLFYEGFQDILLEKKGSGFSALIQVLCKFGVLFFLKVQGGPTDLQSSAERNKNRPRQDQKRIKNRFDSNRPKYHSNIINLPKLKLIFIPKNVRKIVSSFFSLSSLNFC